MISSTWTPMSTDPLGIAGLVVSVVVQAARVAATTIVLSCANVNCIVCSFLTHE